ncbi:MAG: TRAP transporter TatT component family protein [Kofleriaceae bacterium]
MKRLMFVLALAGCSGLIRDQASTETYRILKQGNTAARRTADVELARAALPGGIFQLAAFSAAYPDHRGFKELHAEALCQYAVAFVFDDWEDASLGGRRDEATRLAARLDGLLGACIDANLALLPRTWRPAYGTDAWTGLVAAADRKHAPQLLWIASAEAVRIALEPLRGLAKLGSVIGMLERVTTLSPGFHDADGELLLATLYAGRSRFLGGPDGSAQYAAARRVLGARALLVDVMQARGLAVAKQDRAGFEAALGRVLATDVTCCPELRLANELARIKARRYLAAVDQLIPKS